jgi:hypothetical protein
VAAADRLPRAERFALARLVVVLPRERFLGLRGGFVLSNSVNDVGRGASYSFHGSFHAHFGSLSYGVQNAFFFLLVHAVHLPSC